MSTSDISRDSALDSQPSDDFIEPKTITGRSGLQPDKEAEFYVFSGSAVKELIILFRRLRCLVAAHPQPRPAEPRQRTSTLPLPQLRLHL